ncbi:hypothetical protein HC251_07210 [Iamia sp. SCSIO 61187]|uniref:hypothetical protein n=1 Tax=Iamia sp. SCSIO 61187 TaxID=2722752 RepID=UPI001C638E37|nr:hypothetical protein [Iamia sp. SCSIO 61187]QYG92245.1 hypothetical protein HC251_07210 [Iamia sp. SCSIO 61187]
MTVKEHQGTSVAEVALDRVLARLEERGLAAAVLREPSRDGRGVLEADLLVDPGQRDRVETALVDAGFRRRPGWGRDPHRFFVRPLVTGPDTDWLKLDVVTDLCFGRRHEWPTRLGPDCLRDRRPGPRPRLQPADELVAHLLHALVDRGGLRPRDTVALAQLAGEVDGGGRLALALAEPGIGPASFPGLVAAARDGRWDLVRSAAPRLRRRLVRRHPLQGARRSLTHHVLRRSGRVLRPLAGAGAVVALVGPDGTGKSTLVAGLLDDVGVPARALYGGTYRSGTTASAPGIATARVLARLVATRAALAWHRRMGRLVILDRHPEQARPVPSDGVGWRTRVRRTVLASTLPCPDLLLILDAPADVLHRRRPEHDVRRLAGDRARNLALQMAAPTHVVDATASPEAVRARAVDLIWRHAIPTGTGAPVPAAGLS